MVYDIIIKAIKDPAKAVEVVTRRYRRVLDNTRRRVRYYAGVEPFQRLWVDPEQIKYCTIGRISKPGDYHGDIVGRFEPHDRFYGEVEPVSWGCIKGGNWDNNRIPVKELLVYEGLFKRIKLNIPWEDTPLFQIHLSRIDSGYESFGCRTEKDLLNKCRKGEQLYYKIKTEGYKPQHKLGFPWHPHKEIIVNIGRDGEILFNGQGRHRLSIAKMLNIDQIPVSVLVRHKLS